MTGDIKKAEQIAQSAGGPKQDRSSASRDKIAEDGMMEDGLELAKANKTKAEDPEDVAGRKDKGSMTGLLEKLTPNQSSDPKVV